ncbi:MAG TPA: peroxiredoxin [Alphaproteobacteria bacterium]|nr:peroxiredoxin [Alphaproteobacteria bacterium]
MSAVAVGHPAPDFELMTAAGTRFRLSAQRGRPVVLYFYPEDETEGCTVENLEFTALMPEFQRLGVTVVGISPDTVEKHCKFWDKHDLGTTLVADPGREAIGAYGLWRRKKLFGHEYDGLVRTTFLIDAAGRIARVWPVTRIRGHAAQVLAAARALIDGEATAGGRRPARRTSPQAARR